MDKQVDKQTGVLPESHEESEGEQQSSQRDAVTKVIDDHSNLIMDFTLPLKHGGNTWETQGHTGKTQKKCHSQLGLFTVK